MDVDCVADGRDVVIAGIMEQIELAGVHSGDSACVIPTYMVAPEHVAAMREYTVRLARELGVVGLMNVQYAMKDDVVYVLEVNPRASRTIPFVAKATGVPWAQIAAQCAAGKPLAAWADVIAHGEAQLAGTGGAPPMYHVKEVVLPWARFPGVDTLLGPEMRSTGEAMGSGVSFGEAFAKAQLGCGQKLPLSGNAFLSVNDRDKASLLPIARDLAVLGFTLLATGGTAAYLSSQGLTVTTIYKVNEGRPNAVDYVKNGQIALIVNTPLGKASYFDEAAIRRAAIVYGVPMLTTLSGAAAAVEAIRALRDDVWTVHSLQERA
jgi:carbamoyl-phosphate synthase large subunit